MTAKGIFAHDRAYAPEWPGHVFPAQKYQLVANRIGGPFVAPDPASGEDLNLVHPQSYLDRAERMTERPELGYREFEVPVNRAVVVTLGGGYAFRTQDVVDIHVTTLELMTGSCFNASVRQRAGLL